MLQSPLSYRIVSRLEDSVTVMATGICTEIFFNDGIKYTMNRPYAN